MTQGSNRPRVSLVMPAYNSQRYIASALGSVVAQTMGDFELLVRDDGSTDRTADIVRMYAQSDKRIRLIEGEHVGISRGYNELVEAAGGEYIGLLDSDDMLTPDALAATLAAFVWRVKLASAFFLN